MLVDLPLWWKLCVSCSSLCIPAADAKSCQSCPTLCDPIDGSPTGSWDSPGKDTGVGCHFLLRCMKVKSESEVAQLCATLSDPMDCSPPGSSIHGIFQARVLEWGATAFSVVFLVINTVCEIRPLLALCSLTSFFSPNICYLGTAFPSCFVSHPFSKSFKYYENRTEVDVMEVNNRIVM